MERPPEQTSFRSYLSDLDVKIRKRGNGTSMNSKSNIIETQNLTKDYHGSHSVRQVSLRVPAGCIYGFLGPNGAGKSTTMKMLLGLVKPTAGSITIMGNILNDKNRLDILKHTGSLIEAPSYYGHLTGWENLEIICMLKQIPQKEIHEVLHITRMEKQQDKKAGHYSLGMKQRLGLAAALLGHPKLLLLDEPTNGLDPAGIQEMRELVCSLPQEYGMTVMVSSHLLSEIDQMADYAGIIDKGQLIYQDSLLHLHEHSRKQIRLRTDQNDRALGILERNHILCMPEENSLRFPEAGDERTAFLISVLVREGIGILRVEEYQKSLEEIFISLTGKQVSL